MSRYILSPHAQGTEGWKLDRLGKLTGSNAAAILSKGKSKGAESVMRRNLRFQLSAERLTGKPAESGFSNKHTDRGQEREPFGRMELEARTGCMVMEGGFAYLPTIQAGCSVDGFIDAPKGIIEIKSPILAIHFGYMNEQGAPAEYVPQITHNMWIIGAEYCDFVSYCPDFPEKLALHTVRVPRDDAAIKAYEVEALVFLAEVDELEAELRRRAA